MGGEGEGGRGIELGVGEVAGRAPVAAPTPAWVRDESELHLSL